MKKLLSILTAFVAGIFNLNAQCDWTMDMHDAWGDGWNGASVSVSLAGTATSYEATAGCWWKCSN